MDVLYIPQLDGDDGSGEPLGGRYRILKRIPEDGVVALSDRAITRVEVNGSEPLSLVVPPLVKGAARDFFVRLVVVADEAPQVTFAAPPGEGISFEPVDECALGCDVGINHYALTETDEGTFLVSRKHTVMGVTVALDPCGGTCDVGSVTVRIGEFYEELPVPFFERKVFSGWFTAAEGGEEVKAGDRCRGGARTLYAHWEDYDDPFVDAICPAKNLVFYSDTAVPWKLDTSVFRTSPASARSGAVGDNGTTTLRTTVQGPGELAFWMKASSEQGYDKLVFCVDGVNKVTLSGEMGWRMWSGSVTGAGRHVLEWRYVKDGTQSISNDCCWIDEVVWTPEG